MFSLQRMLFLALKWYKWSKSESYHSIKKYQKTEFPILSSTGGIPPTPSKSALSVCPSVCPHQKWLLVFLYIYTYTSFKSKIHVRQVFRTWVLNQQEFVERNLEWILMLLVEALALNKCLLGEMKYIYKTKSLKACLQNLFMKNKAKQKIIIMTIIKKIQTVYYHEILFELLLETVVLTCEFKTTRELLKRMSNLLVANMY